MNEQEILEAIETILYNASYPQGQHGMRFYAQEKNVYKFYNETVALLQALYQKLLDDKDKQTLLTSLRPEPSPIFFIKGINFQKSYNLIYKNQDFIFVFFVKTRKTDAALEMISKNIIISSTKNKILKALYEILEIEPDTFDNNQLKQIINIMDNFNAFIRGKEKFDKDEKVSLDGKNFVPTYDTKQISNYQSSESSQVPECTFLVKRISDIAYRIKKDRLSSILLEGINIEINQDQGQLKHMITDFKFNPSLSDTLAKIDEKLYNAKDLFDFKNCMDLIRAFLTELCASIAGEIKKETQIAPTMPIEGSGKMGKAMDYFRDKRINFLTEIEKDLLAALNSYLSYEGVHALKSERESARISRNMAIEVALFLIKKLNKFSVETSEKSITA